MTLRTEVRKTSAKQGRKNSLERQQRVKTKIAKKVKKKKKKKKKKKSRERQRSDNKQ